MAGETRHPVVILYEHALLGEGIAKYLRTHSGFEAKVVSAADREGVRSALAFGPAVVVFESNDPCQRLNLRTLAPHAVLIDVSTVISRGSVLTPCGAGFEQILQAVRESSSTVVQKAETRAAAARTAGSLAAPAR